MAEGSRKFFPIPLRKKSDLLDVHFGASGLDLFLDLGGFFLGDTFFESLGGSFDEGFRLGESETGHSGADLFNDGNLVAACIGEDDIEGCLLLSGGSCSGGTGGCNGYGSSGADAPFFFELFNEVSDFEDGESAELIDECLCVCHMMCVFWYRRFPRHRVD